MIKKAKPTTRINLRVPVALLVGFAIGAASIKSVGYKVSGTNLTERKSLPSVDAPMNFGGLLSKPMSGTNMADITVINLLCAEGLPGSEGMNIQNLTNALNQWSKHVATETKSYLYKFRQNPADFENSEAYFRILTMVTILQQDFDVHYNLERIQTPDFGDSKDLFLHGLLEGKHEGTCVSMPVLYVAVGRRLGYPLKLVTAKGHLFARWESLDGKERFNIESTSQGLNCFPDEYYKTWPVPISPQELASGQYLKSLSPEEEVAVFLSARGHCLEATGRLAEAEVAHASAHAYAPNTTAYLAFLAGAVRKEMPEWQRVAVNLGQADAESKSESK